MTVTEVVVPSKGMAQGRPPAHAVIARNIERLMQTRNLELGWNHWTKKRVAAFMDLSSVNFSHRLAGRSAWQEGEIEVLKSLFDLPSNVI